MSHETSDNLWRVQITVLWTTRGRQRTNMKLWLSWRAIERAANSFVMFQPMTQWAKVRALSHILLSEWKFSSIIHSHSLCYGFGCLASRIGWNAFRSQVYYPPSWDFWWCQCDSLDVGWKLVYRYWVYVAQNKIKLYSYIFTEVLSIN